MNHLVIDIETVPLEIKDDVIKEYLMDKKIDKESRSLHPLYSKIICIVIKGDEETVLIGEEKDILERFWSIAKEYSRFVTHNGYGFDIPFIIVRSAINNVNFHSKIWLNKYSMIGSNHFDTMLFFSQNGVFFNVRLDIIARSLGIETSDDISGRDVERLYKEGNINKIIEHCRKDVQITEKIYLFLKDG